MNGAPGGPRIAVRAPNHLGDGVLALPAIRALAELGPLTVQGPRWAGDLYRDVPARILPRGRLADADAAVLLAPSLRAAWEARHIRRRIGVPWDSRRWLLTDVVQPGLHTVDTYARLAAVLGACTRGDPRYPHAQGDPLPDLPEGHVGLDPFTGAGLVKQWSGFRELADRLTMPGRSASEVVFYGGPGRSAAVRALAGPHRSCVGLPLPALSAALRRCSVFVSHDSGVAHFARACDVPVVAIFGPTVPERTGPRGARVVQRRGPACRPCYGSACRRGHSPCLDIDVDRVLRRVVELRDG